MSTQFNLNRDQTGVSAYAPYFAYDNYQTILSASVAQSFTIPSNYSIWCAIFSFTPGASVWVAKNTTATLPGGSFSTTLSTLNPQARYVNAGDILSFITSDTTDEVGVTLYAYSL
jgi:hypothetical protein